MFCPRQGPGGGGHKGWLSGLGASRCCSTALLPSYSFPTPFLLLPFSCWPPEPPATHTQQQAAKANTSYEAPLALHKPHTEQQLQEETLQEGFGGAGDSHGDQWQPWVTSDSTGCTHWWCCSSGPLRPLAGSQVKLSEGRAELGISTENNQKTFPACKVFWKRHPFHWERWAL